jgi:predicted ferric reductase
VYTATNVIFLKVWVGLAPARYQVLKWVWSGGGVQLRVFIGWSEKADKNSESEWITNLWTSRNNEQRALRSELQRSANETMELNNVGMKSRTMIKWINVTLISERETPHTCNISRRQRGYCSISTVSYNLCCWKGTYP